MVVADKRVTGLDLRRIAPTVLVSPRPVTRLLGALREGDYSIRGTGAKAGSAVDLVMTEINALGDTLQRQRTEAVESTKLLQSVMGAIDVAVFAFDMDEKLVLVDAECAAEHGVAFVGGFDIARGRYDQPLHQIVQQLRQRALAERRLLRAHDRRPRFLLEQLPGNPRRAAFDKRLGLALRSPARQRHA